MFFYLIKKDPKSSKIKKLDSASIVPVCNSVSECASFTCVLGILDHSDQVQTATSTPDMPLRMK